jgi:hypothetical protein
MYTDKFIKTGAFIILAITLSLSACKRDKDKNLDGDEGGYAADQARLEQSFDDAQNISDEAAMTGSVSNYRTLDQSVLSHCATVTHDTISIPHTITIDFGPTNCLGHDGRNRRGQILVSYTGHYRDSGHVHTISFNNYFVNDNQLTGTKTVTNMGHNSLGQSYFTIAVNGSLILANNAGTRSWTSTRTRTWTAGEATPVRIDDEYTITGSGTVTRPNSTSFTINITSPLLRALNCQWTKQGTIQITPSSASAPVRTLDYGSGTCDNQATLTVNGNSTTITLP